jgi:penicillin-binding protein 2
MLQDSVISDPRVEQKIFVVRLTVASVLVLALTSLMLFRYFDLQIVRHQDYITNSNNNRIHIRPVPPPRGLIFDRHGQLLADNRPTFTLNIIADRTDTVDELLNQLRSLITISERDLSRFKKGVKRGKSFDPIPLKYGLTEQERAILAVNSHLLPGAEVSAQLTRFYPSRDLFTHVIGYVGRINEQDSQRINLDDYQGTDFIGKIGLEQFYENQLLGSLGTEQVETNARGRVMRVLGRTDPVPGNNLEIHIDSRLQQIAQKALQGTRGALVAIDIQSGGILSMVSMPSYDPNLFVSGISQVDYDKLLNSTDQPLFNRALRGQYPPGSTLKPLFGLIGLQNNIFDMDYSIFDPGYFFMEGIERPWRDHNADSGGHGHGVDLAKAIIESCDVFFYTIGIKTGIDLLAKESAKFSLGQVTGIDLYGEQKGIMPSREWKRKHRNQNWFDGDTINMSIGQGFMLTTPLQLAVMSARIASRGKPIKPQLLKSINGQDIQQEPAPDRIQIDKEYWDYVHQAMVDVVHSDHGTAVGISKDLSYKIAGKTGTAQVISINEEEEYDSSKIDKRNWDHALFIAFAPAEDPKIAVGLIVENGEHGSLTAAPIARKVIDAYMSNPEPETHISSTLNTAFINAQTGGN